MKESAVLAVPTKVTPRLAFILFGRGALKDWRRGVARGLDIYAFAKVVGCLAAPQAEVIRRVGAGPSHTSQADLVATDLLMQAERRKPISHIGG